jgi:hypothetical protein
MNVMVDAPAEDLCRILEKEVKEHARRLGSVREALSDSLTEVIYPTYPIISYHIILCATLTHLYMLLLVRFCTLSASVPISVTNYFCFAMDRRGMQRMIPSKWIWNHMIDHISAK